MIKFHGDLTAEKFWLDWFGPLARELGTNKSPHRVWTDNPNDLIEHIKMCAKEHEEGEYCRPCWISSQPMRLIKYKNKERGEASAIEKLFFDFDDDTKYCSKCDIYIKKDELIKPSACPKCKTECIEKPRRDVVGNEVKEFIANITQQEMLIVETRKGYHVYIFLRQIWQFEKKNFELAKKIYEELQNMYITKKYEFLDTHIIGDLNRFARVPLTAHEKTGAFCQIVDRNLQPTKIRNLEYFRTYGITSKTIENVINKILLRKFNQAQEEMEEIENVKHDITNGNNGNFEGKIRPCFQKRMDNGEMNHAQRLALLSEAYYSGYQTEDALVDIFRCFTDFKEEITHYQVQWFLNHNPEERKPYRCSTLMQKGWCIGNECSIWRYRQNNKKIY